MSKENFHLIVKITSIPPGEAPKWVNKHWVGLVMSGIRETGTYATGVLSGKPAPKGKVRGGFTISAREALRQLFASNPESLKAVRWWYDNYLKDHPNGDFVFSPGCFEEIKLS
jgi:hypothetical protein